MKWRFVFLFLFFFTIAKFLEVQFPKDQFSHIRQVSRPGEFVGTLLLGSLRPLLVDLLWLRAENKRSQGKFFEELAIFNLLKELQPRSTSLWELASYNLVYNISLSFPKKEDQWKWIRAGILYLKEGIARNPSNPHLKRQMAFFLWHRIRQTPQGAWLWQSKELTFFEKQYQNDRELNPKGWSSSHKAFSWAYLALSHFQHFDALSFVILTSSLQRCLANPRERDFLFEYFGEKLEQLEKKYRTAWHKSPPFFRYRWSQFYLYYAHWLKEKGREKKALEKIQQAYQLAPKVAKKLYRKLFEN